MEQDLIETGGKVMKNDQSLEKGSSAFNRVLLKVNAIGEVKCRIIPLEGKEFSLLFQSSILPLKSP